MHARTTPPSADAIRASHTAHIASLTDQLKTRPITLQDVNFIKTRSYIDPLRCMTLLAANAGNVAPEYDSAIVTQTMRRLASTNPVIARQTVDALLGINTVDAAVQTVQIVCSNFRGMPGIVKSIADSSTVQKVYILTEIGRQIPACTQDVIQVLSEMDTGISLSSATSLATGNGHELAEFASGLNPKLAASVVARQALEQYRNHEADIDAVLAAVEPLQPDEKIDILSAVCRGSHSTGDLAKVVAALQPIDDDYALTQIFEIGAAPSVRLNSIQALEAMRASAVSAQKNDLTGYDSRIESLLEATLRELRHDLDDGFTSIGQNTTEYGLAFARAATRRGQITPDHVSWFAQASCVYEQGLQLTRAEENLERSCPVVKASAHTFTPRVIRLG